MTYKHGIPEHAVESTHKFFNRVWVGKHGGRHGEDEYGYKMSWDSRHEDLKPSTTYDAHNCVYCGKRPMPIQPDHLGYTVTGYVCLCREATEEVELNAQIEAMQERHAQELHELALKLPKPSSDVKRKLIEKKLTDDYYLDRVMKSLGY